MRYQTLDRIRKKNADYNLIMSGRSTGKSTSMVRFLVDEYKNKGRKFLRLFRKKNNLYETADTWFNELNENGLFYEGDEITWDGEHYYINGEFFGDTAVISLGSTYRSKVFDRAIYHAVFDEYIALSPNDYVDYEVTKFKNILTTCFRKRDRQVWLLGNNENEYSKINPYHQYFGINIDRDKIKMGDIKVYKSKNFSNPAVVAFEFGYPAHTNEEEIAKAERLDNNEVVTSGDFAKVYYIFNQNERYAGGLSFLRDSIDNYYIKDGLDQCYFPVVNDELQTIDWCMSDNDLSMIGDNGDAELYDKLMNYQEFYKNLYGENDYMKMLDEAMPYKIAIPLFANGNRYGVDCLEYLSGIRRNLAGFTDMFCDANIKRIYEDIVVRGKME